MRSEQPDLLDSQAYITSRYPKNAPSLAFPGGDEAAVAAWKTKARSKLQELMGGFPVDKTPLEPVLGKPVAKKGYTRYTVTFNTRPDRGSFGYLLVPDGLKAKVPAFVCVPGHGRGVDDLVGILPNGKERDHKDGYQHDYAIQCVEKGYVTLAVEPIGFGHRRNPAARKSGPESSSCLPTSGAALMLGETILGWRVWDVLRAVDFLETRPEVDVGKIATMGISGGGTISLYAAAIDERIRASMLSCSFCTFKDSIYSISHCMDNYVPGILRWFEVSDIAGLIAPRFLFTENGLRDTIFPEPGVRQALRETETIYKHLGALGNLDHHFFDDGHIFDGSKAFVKLKQWFGA